jgi:hypothetical protein
MRWLIAAALLGCQPKPEPLLSNKLSPTAIAAPTCREAGVILRAHVNDEARAGPAKEALIASTCEADHWPADVVGCIASSPQPKTCLDRLTDMAHASYDKRLRAWADQYGEDVDELDLDRLGPPVIACEDAIGDGALYPPAITLAGEDRAFAVAARTAAVTKLCQAGWDEPVKSCLQAAKDAASVATCVGSLLLAQSQELADRLAAIDTVIARTIAARAKAPDCKKLVAAYYADAAWQHKLADVKGADRAKMIDDSRKRMTDACTADAWSVTVRACLAAGGAADCFPGASFAWEFPAAGVTGIGECDAYVAQIQSYAACDKLPQPAREAFANAASDVLAGIRQIANEPSRRVELSESCKHGREAVKQAASQAGC